MITQALHRINAQKRNKPLLVPVTVGGVWRGVYRKHECCAQYVVVNVSSVVHVIYGMGFIYISNNVQGVSFVKMVDILIS